MPARPPTSEQRAAVDAFRAGAHLVLQAGAGTGKTTTLTMLGASTRRRGRYLAFNKAIATEARRLFGPNVACATAHSLAFKAVGHRYQDRLNHPRMATAKLARSLGITMEVTIGERKLTTAALCYAAQRTVILYCYSADETLDRQHVPWLKGIGEEHLHDQLTHLVLPYARRMWADLQNPERGRVPFKHDHYLKMWALTRPRLYGDFFLLDEAQDTNPVVEQVFLAQGEHAQLVMVGDSAQAIYGWRGARDVMTGFAGRRLALSHSFRFGDGVAAEANRWLAIAGAPIRLTGSPAVASRVETVEQPDAILCRTNGGAMAEILTLLGKGRRVALAGRAAVLQSLAEAARDLQAGRRTTHPELLLFASWGEVQDYAEWDPDGRDLLSFVEVIDEHGADVVLDTLSRLAAETHADVVVSTAHAAKGREWASVRIADDFPEPVDPENTGSDGEPLPGRIEPSEARLAYVAVTRARNRLDLGGLAWINRHPDGNPGSEQRGRAAS
ncbi:DNA helicase [Amycolatopsis mediterranei S699]|uniref:DNA helicase n=2 Tax=Amycolatopsis mediterranei TaxID=33910 RepID=A0A9R0U8S2_AMYMS|nr:UvrD-helicase domain-containing protein [Amycolatopsis mediterranei]ADJ45314.1 putative DNA helicase [Amycolatopsis mediterranei U32]AEK42074.1 DNA helicase [Amycolatopsis mediterranei S699]AFO77025.1 DNA helicase [Amycolatopsis mediterranei S699]AGT84153.1 DNA helicase [Amycolatopsis mediterranei RB]KDO08430.1 DNA helicase [Amycolatopsis mediterranei]